MATPHGMRYNGAYYTFPTREMAVSAQQTVLDAIIQFDRPLQGCLITAFDGEMPVQVVFTPGTPLVFIGGWLIE